MPNKYIDIYLGFIAATLLVLICALLWIASSGPSADDIDRANFMMECVYGWDQIPDNCREILDGKDPPYLP